MEVKIHLQADAAAETKVERTASGTTWFDLKVDSDCLTLFLPKGALLPLADSLLASATKLVRLAKEDAEACQTKADDS